MLLSLILGKCILILKLKPYKKGCVKWKLLYIVSRSMRGKTKSPQALLTNFYDKINQLRANG